MGNCDDDAPEPTEEPRILNHGDNVCNMLSDIHAATSALHLSRTRGGPVGIMKPLLIKD